MTVSFEFGMAVARRLEQALESIRKFQSCFFFLLKNANIICLASSFSSTSLSVGQESNMHMNTKLMLMKPSQLHKINLDQ